MSAIPRARESTNCGFDRDGIATTATGRLSQPHSASTRTHAARTFGGTGAVADGQQIVFARIRFRIDDGVPWVR